MANADLHSTTRRSRKPVTVPAKARRSPRKPAAPIFEDPATFPDTYCMKIVGNCMASVVSEGGSVMIQKSATYAVGDLVCIWWRPEILKPGMTPAWFKRLTMNAAHWVKSYPYTDHPQSEVTAIIMVEQLNPRQGYTIRCNSILAIHKAIGWSPAGKERGGMINTADVKLFPNAV